LDMYMFLYSTLYSCTKCPSLYHPMCSSNQKYLQDSGAYLSHITYISVGTWWNSVFLSFIESQYYHWVIRCLFSLYEVLESCNFNHTTNCSKLCKWKFFIFFLISETVSVLQVWYKDISYIKLTCITTIDTYILLLQ
jgi:hypothetical protein